MEVVVRWDGLMDGRMGGEDEKGVVLVVMKVEGEDKGKSLVCY